MTKVVKIIILLVMTCAVITGCSANKGQKTLESALAAIYTCPNTDIVAAYDTTAPDNGDAVQDNVAADKVIQDVYGEYFTEQALELLASGRRASKFHMAAAEGGYTMSISDVKLTKVEAATAVEYDFTAEVVTNATTTVAGRVQFKDGKISSLKFTKDISVQ